MALSTTAMMMPSAMVRIAWLRCGCGRPSACSIGAGDMVEARLIRAVVRLRIRKLRDASQPGRIRTVPAPGAGLPARGGCLAGAHDATAGAGRLDAAQAGLRRATGLYTGGGLRSVKVVRWCQ